MQIPEATLQHCNLGEEKSGRGAKRLWGIFVKLLVDEGCNVSFQTTYDYITYKTKSLKFICKVASVEEFS